MFKAIAWTNIYLSVEFSWMEMSDFRIKFHSANNMKHISVFTCQLYTRNQISMKHESKIIQENVFENVF